MISIELDRLKTIAIEIARLERVPTLVTQVKDEYSTFTCQAKLRHSDSKSIPRSYEDDQKQIPDVNAIRLHAVEAIQKALGLL
jgi:hypothetical protein